MPKYASFFLTKTVKKTDGQPNEAISTYPHTLFPGGMNIVWSEIDLD